jgi:catechol 2,3-dioxygenase-like lactoylglutathione lyase family enzyme
MMPTSSLAGTVKGLRPFVPAKDFETSKRFYADLGFEIEALDENLAAIRLGNHTFLLQNYFVEAWASNFMLYLVVSNLDAWWTHITSLELATRYGVPQPRPPKREPWGANVVHVIDPAGVLWHIAETA